jgi:hypothetical protein
MIDDKSNDKRNIKERIDKLNDKISRKKVERPVISEDEYYEYEREYKELEKTIVEDIYEIEDYEKSKKNEYRLMKIEERIKDIESKFKFDKKCKSCGFNRKRLLGELEEEKSKIIIIEIDEKRERELKGRIKRWEELSKKTEYINVMDEIERYKRNCEKVKRMEEEKKKLEDELKKLRVKKESIKIMEEELEEIKYCINTRDKCLSDEKLVNEQIDKWKEYDKYEEIENIRGRIKKIDEKIEMYNKYNKWKEVKGEYDGFRETVKDDIKG